jgi:EAL domain-containing protein (putative c-di-GMP-specific phosphodiesterase class I)
MTKDYKIGICFFSANHAALIEILGLIVKYKRFQQEKQFSVAHVDIHMLFADINISSVISKKGSVMMYISSVISKKGSVMMLYILYMNVIGNPTLHVDTY